MKKLSSIILVIVLIITLSACGKDKKTNSPGTSTDAINVTVFEAKEQTLENTVTYTGEIKASQYTSVSAKVSGTAKAIYKEVGDYVNEGDILAQLDDTDYRSQYNQAKAQYSSALAQYNSATNGSAQQTKLQLEAALNSATIEFNNAKTNYENQKVLYENGAISKIAFDSAQTRFENAQINLNSAKSNYELTINVILNESNATAKAALDAASVAVDMAESALNNTVVRAPISGYIGNRNINKGQLVSPGVEIYSIKATDSVQAEINVTESIISNISEGTKAIINVKSAGMENIAGFVSVVSPVKSQQTGMYKVSVAIENADGKLKDGMFADITLTIDNSANAIIVPTESIFEDEDGGKYVYIADKNTANKVNVVIGITTDSYTEIANGITKGDKVIVSGAEYLSEKNNSINIVK